MPRLSISERNALVEANMGLATHFASNFQASRMEFEDLVQEAYMGLIDAAELYDPKRGTKFSTYARWHILKRVMDSIHNRNEIVRTPRRRPAHICAHLDEEQMVRIADPGPTAMEQLDEDDMVNEVRELIKLLPAREAIVIRLRHGINTEKMTLAKIGDILAVTPERVRQIQNMAEEKLRQLLAGSAILRDHGAATAGHPKEPAQPKNET